MATETEPDERTVALSDGRTVGLSVPDDATDDEAAALVACLGAYLHDRQRAATADQADDSPDPAEAWSLAGRYGCRTRTDLPRGTVQRGEEWKMAGRSNGYR